MADKKKEETPNEADGNPKAETAGTTDDQKKDQGGSLSGLPVWDHATHGPPPDIHRPFRQPAIRGVESGRVLLILLVQLSQQASSVQPVLRP